MVFDVTIKICGEIQEMRVNCDSENASELIEIDWFIDFMMGKYFL